MDDHRMVAFSLAQLFEIYTRVSENRMVEEERECQGSEICSRCNENKENPLR